MTSYGDRQFLFLRGPDSDYTICPTCGGNGWIWVICSDCGGYGTINGATCTTCGGDREVRQDCPNRNCDKGMVRRF